MSRNGFLNHRCLAQLPTGFRFRDTSRPMSRTADLPRDSPPIEKGRSPHSPPCALLNRYVISCVRPPIEVSSILKPSSQDLRQKSMNALFSLAQLFVF